MGKKTITMSYDDYQMISVENETYKLQYEELKQEKKVFLTVVTRGMDISQMSGQIVDKDELLKKMQGHLSLMKKRGDERETNYIQHIATLEKQLDQVSIIHAPVKAVTKWWHKLLK
jgi:adenine-specific DNA methylase